MEIVGGWNDDDRTYVVLRDGDEKEIRTYPARWAFFLSGASASDAAALARLPEVLSVSERGSIFRVDCRSRWYRKKLIGRLSRNIDPSKILEGDVSPIRRWLTDNHKERISDAPRVGYLDLETDSRKTFPEAIGGKARILSWALELPNGKMRADVLREDTDDDEKRIIQRLFRELGGCDVVCAWSGDRFDFPVLKNRHKAVKAGPKEELRKWQWLDHLEVYKKYHAHGHKSGAEHSSYKLGAVATAQLGTGKEDFDASKTWEYWESGGQSRQDLVSYNVQDTRLLRQIEDATGYLALHLAVCSICRVLPSSKSLRATEQGDGFLMTLGIKENHRWPTKWGEEGHSKFLGAYIMNPTRIGLVETVHVADFAGLYPSIMRSWNMSPETVRSSLTNEERSNFLKLPERATWFDPETRGLVPKALDILVEAREEYKKAQASASPGTPEWDRAKRLSSAFKIVANSFYGIVGSPYSRFYDPDVAEGVTQTGKWLLHQVIAEAKKEGLDPFYGDTDSVFISGDLERLRGIVDAMNKAWPEVLREFNVSDSCIQLDYEKTFDRLIMVSKKRYAGRLTGYKGQAGEVFEIKGLEYMRGDTVPLARQMQREIIGLLLRENPAGYTEIMETINGWSDRIVSRDFSFEDAILSQSLKSDPEAYDRRYSTDSCKGCKYDFGSKKVGPEEPAVCPKCKAPRKVVALPAHVRIGLEMKQRGEEVGEGTRVFYVYAKGGKKPEPILANEPDAFDRLDLDYLWKNRVYPPTERVLEAVWPDQPWKDSRKVMKRTVDDLPLFQRASSNPGITDEKNPVKVSGFPKDRLALEAVRRLAEACPGSHPLSIEIRIKKVDISKPADRVTIETGLAIELSSRFRAGIGRLEGLEILDGKTAEDYKHSTVDGSSIARELLRGVFEGGQSEETTGNPVRPIVRRGTRRRGRRTGGGSAPQGGGANADRSQRGDGKGLSGDSGDARAGNREAIPGPRKRRRKVLERPDGSPTPSEPKRRGPRKRGPRST